MISKKINSNYRTDVISNIRLYLSKTNRDVILFKSTKDNDSVLIAIRKSIVKTGNTSFIKPYATLTLGHPLELHTKAGYEYDNFYTCDTLYEVVHSGFYVFATDIKTGVTDKEIEKVLKEIKDWALSIPNTDVTVYEV